MAKEYVQVEKLCGIAGFITKFKHSLKSLNKAEAQYKRQLEAILAWCKYCYGPDGVYEIRFYWKVGQYLRTPENPETDDRWRYTYIAWIVQESDDFDGEHELHVEAKFRTSGVSCLEDEIKPDLAIKKRLVSKLLKQFVDAQEQ